MNKKSKKQLKSNPEYKSPFDNSSENLNPILSSNNLDDNLSRVSVGISESNVKEIIPNSTSVSKDINISVSKDSHMIGEEDEESEEEGLVDLPEGERLDISDDEDTNVEGVLAVVFKIYYCCFLRKKLIFIFVNSRVIE